ncbi:hypothetical protein BDV09DRAFT_181332 [Aspergillus tetrazonus]
MARASKPKATLLAGPPISLTALSLLWQIQLQSRNWLRPSLIESVLKSFRSLKCWLSRHYKRHYSAAVLTVMLESTTNNNRTKRDFKLTVETKITYRSR